MRRPKKREPISKEDNFLEQLYDEYATAIYSSARKIVRNKSDVDDVVQDTWCKLILNRDQLRDLKPWQRKKYIAKTLNCAYEDIVRKRKPDLPLNEEICASSMDRGWDLDTFIHNQDQLRKLEAQLPARDWFVLKGKYCYGYSDEELGQRIGVQADSVRGIRSRMIKKAKNLLLGGSLIGGGGSER